MKDPAFIPDYSLYLATDTSVLSRFGDEFVAVLESCLGSGGATMLQLRFKELPTRTFYELGLRVRAVTSRLRVPLIVNDRVDLAMALSADGVHLGRSDLPPAAARRLLPRGLIGCSANLPDDVRRAQDAGADYIGAGPVFRTATKSDTGPELGLDGLRQIVLSSRLPVVAIGGIGTASIGAVRKTGAAGVCLISAVFQAPNPAEATRRLRSLS